jgi:nucleotide-binding universal stress UspA family protein
MYDAEKHAYSGRAIHQNQSHHKREKRMHSKILVAYNGTPESRIALNECIRLAPGASAQIHLLAVITPSPIVLLGEFSAAVLPTEEEQQAERRTMLQVLESGRNLLTEAGLTVITHLESGEPIDVIAEMAEKFKIELVIVGHTRHKPWAMRWWKGSVDAMLIDRVRCTLLVAGDPHYMG